MQLRCDGAAVGQQLVLPGLSDSENPVAAGPGIPGVLSMGLSLQAALGFMLLNIFK